MPRQASEQHIYSYACGVNHRASISSGPVRALPERAEAGRKQTPMSVWRQKDSPASRSPHLTRPQPSAPRARGHACARAIALPPYQLLPLLSSLKVLAANAHIQLLIRTTTSLIASNSLMSHVITLSQ